MLILTAAINFIGIFIVLPARAQSVSTVAGTSKAAHLTVTVKEAITNIPLENATVCIIETNSYYQTDKGGKTKLITVPVIKNANFDGSSPRPWGEITLFVYKDGYIDFILFYVMVYEGQTRTGPNITLYPNYDPENAVTHSLIEGPDNDWVETLTKKYRK